MRTTGTPRDPDNFPNVPIFDTGIIDFTGIDTTGETIKVEAPLSGRIVAIKVAPATGTDDCDITIFDNEDSELMHIIYQEVGATGGRIDRVLDIPYANTNGGNLENQDQIYIELKKSSGGIGTNDYTVRILIAAGTLALSER